MSLHRSTKSLRGRSISRPRLLSRLGMCVVVVLVATFTLAWTATEASSGPLKAKASNGSVIYSGKGAVAFFAPSVTISIWSNAWINQFTYYMHQVAPNVKVLAYYANFDPATQLAQVQAAIQKGAKVLIMAAVDPNHPAAMFQYAKAHHVPMLAAQRSVVGAPIAGQTGDDAFGIGKALASWLVDNTSQGQTIATLWGDATDAGYAVPMKNGAMSVLQPLYDSGARKEAGNVFTPGYTAQKAHDEMSAILSQTGNKVDGVLTANDDMAGGAIAAISAAGLSGKVKVIGSDTTIAAVQRVLLGTQAATIYHARSSMKILAKASSYLLAGKAFPKGLFNTTSPNGTYKGKKITIPYATQPPIPITKANVGLLLKEHFLTKKLICNGMPPGNSFCQG